MNSSSLHRGCPEPLSRRTPAGPPPTHLPSSSLLPGLSFWPHPCAFLARVCFVGYKSEHITTPPKNLSTFRSVNSSLLPVNSSLLPWPSHSGHRPPPPPPPQAQSPPSALLPGWLPAVSLVASVFCHLGVFALLLLRLHMPRRRLGPAWMSDPPAPLRPSGVLRCAAHSSAAHQLLAQASSLILLTSGPTWWRRDYNQAWEAVLLHPCEAFSTVSGPHRCAKVSCYHHHHRH